MDAVDVGFELATTGLTSGVFTSACTGVAGTIGAGCTGCATGSRGFESPVVGSTGAFTIGAGVIVVGEIGVIGVCTHKSGTIQLAIIA